jgi:hypothetical protein
MRYSKFFCWRVVNAALSYAFARLLLLAFPQNIAVAVSNGVTFYSAFSVSARPIEGSLFN